jgi:hypothetical protein
MYVQPQPDHLPNDALAAYRVFSLRQALTAPSASELGIQTRVLVDLVKSVWLVVDLPRRDEFRASPLILNEMIVALHDVGYLVASLHWQPSHLQ